MTRRYGPYRDDRPAHQKHDPEPEYIDEKEHRRRERYGQNPPRATYRVEVYKPLTDEWYTRETLRDATLERARANASYYVGTLGERGARVTDASGETVWEDMRDREAWNG